MDAADIVVDAADSLALTYILSDACREARRPLVSASVLGLAGYVGVFCGGAPSYRAVFPDMPRQAGSCAASGVLGTAVGVIGTLQAHLALALLLELQPPVARAADVGGFPHAARGRLRFRRARLNRPVRTRLHRAGAKCSAQDVVIDLRQLAEAPRSPFAGALRVDVETVERAPTAAASRRARGVVLSQRRARLARGTGA